MFTAVQVPAASMASTFENTRSSLFHSRSASIDAPESEYQSKSENKQRARRNSWIHNFSHQLASQSNSSFGSSLRRSVSHETPVEQMSVNIADYKPEAAFKEVVDQPKEDEIKKDQPEKGFFSAFRRMSASKSCLPSRECRRTVFNKNSHRQVCPLQELQSLKMKRVAFKVEEIDDETITREPLYCQIRNALKYQEALLVQKRQAIAAAVASKTACLPPSLDDRAVAAGLDCFRPCRYVAKPPKSVVAEKAVLLLDGPASSPKKEKSDALDTLLPAAKEQTGSNPGSRRASVSGVSSDRSRSGSLSSTPDEPDDSEDLARVYVRCCKLRELRPAPAIYDQAKGHHDNMEKLKIGKSNGETPSFGQMQVIADFIACIPVSDVDMNDLSLSDDLARPIFASLASSQSLKSLSLRRAKVSSKGWKAICYLVAMNKNMERIDLSGVKRKTAEWVLLTKSVEARSAHINLIVTDCDISPAEKSALSACSH
ncbi:hypothetical protein V1512DRAFT_267414 [Lipomyces arxii]|uniref:uncharacterized protein n=1 Tax=Lipomyces arxii TaxID=56418 RepID=UPI0034CDD816